MDARTVEQLAEILQEPKAPLLRQVLRTFGPERTVLCQKVCRDCLKDWPLT
jgi:hypothetical protein